MNKFVHRIKSLKYMSRHHPPISSLHDLCLPAVVTLIKVSADPAHFSALRSVMPKVGPQGLASCMC